MHMASCTDHCCRALLDLDFEDAEFIEKEMAQGSTFSI